MNVCAGDLAGRHKLVCALFCLIIVVAQQLSGSAVVAGESDAAAHDFRSYCAPCHGLDGRGDGPVAQVLKTRPSDLTKLAARYGGVLPFEAVYKRIEGRDMPDAHGSSDMPVWGLWFSNQAVGENMLNDSDLPVETRVRERITAIVHYLETIQE